MLAKAGEREGTGMLKRLALIAQTGFRITPMMKDREAIRAKADTISELCDRAPDEVTDGLRMKLYAPARRCRCAGNAPSFHSVRHGQGPAPWEERSL